jgi:hypothetical protein
VLSGAVTLVGMAAVTTVNDLLDGHVSLDVECLDRIYLNGYVPNLQVGGQVASFMTAHLGFLIPSPAILEKMGTAFRRSVSSFAETEHVPVVRFKKDDRKIEVMGRHIAAQAATGRSGVAAIGVAQEYQNVFAANQRQASNGIPWFSFTKADRRVSCFYFYLWGATRSPETAACVAGDGRSQGLSWRQLIHPTVGVIPAPRGAWRKSDIPMVATGHQGCEAGCNGDNR